MDYIDAIQAELESLREENRNLKDKLDIYEQELFLLRENQKLTRLVVPLTLKENELTVPF